MAKHNQADLKHI